MSRRPLIAVALLLALAAPAAAVETTYSSAGVASRWLNLPRNAWEAGLAGGIGALGTGLAGAQAEPAALASLPGGEASLGYRLGGVDSSISSLALGFPGLGGGWLLSYDHLDLGGVDSFAVNSAGTLTQGETLHPWEGALGLGYGRQLPGGLRAGLALHGVMQNLESQQNYNFGLDASLAATFLDDIEARLGLANLSAGGPQAGGQARTSLAWRAPASLSLGAELRLPLEDSGLWQTLLGLEWGGVPHLPLRGGYALGGERAPRGWSVGFGVDFLPVSLDYAFSGVGELGSTQQLSLNYRFNQAAAGPAAMAPAAVAVATPASTPVPVAPAPSSETAAVQQDLDALLQAVKSHDDAAVDQLATKLQGSQFQPQVQAPLVEEQRQAVVTQLKDVEVRQAVYSGDDEHAEKSLNTLARVEPQNAYAQVALGVFASREGRYQEALAHFEEAYRLDPGRSYLPRFIEQARDAAAGR